MQATTVDEFSKALGFVLARPIINKSGITGLFDFHLEYAIDETTGGPARATPSDEPAGPSIFTAIQEQLGLKLDSDKGPVNGSSSIAWRGPQAINPLAQMLQFPIWPGTQVTRAKSHAC